MEGKKESVIEFLEMLKLKITCIVKGKLSGDLTEKWGILDITIGNIKTSFKKEIDESRLVLESHIQTDKGWEIIIFLY